MSRALLATLLILCAAACAVAQSASPSATTSAPPRVFVLHKDLPVTEKGGRVPALIGQEPIYTAGEQVQFGAYNPGGDDFILESVQVKLSTPYSNSVGYTMPLTETNSSSNTYIGIADVNERLVVQTPTRDRGFAVLLCDPSQVGVEFAQMAMRGFPGMPREDLGQISVAAPGEFAPPVRRWLEQGGAEPVTISYGPLHGRFLVGRCANLLYVSGRYDPLSGFVSLGGLAPQEVLGNKWADSLQVLVLSAGFAADVNDEDAHQPPGPMRGQHGPEWWKKFSRTLLGYTGPAPAPDAEAAIARRFLKLASGGPAKDEAAKSAHFVRAWLTANQQQLFPGAVAIDSRGSYHMQLRARALTLRGVPFTVPAIDPWTVTTRDEWEARAIALREESLHTYWSDYLLAELAKQRAGAPPSAGEFVTEAGIDWILTASRHPTKDAPLRGRAKAVMTRRHRYAEHVYRSFVGRPK